MYFKQNPDILLAIDIKKNIQYRNIIKESRLPLSCAVQEEEKTSKIKWRNPIFSTLSPT
jgi:hypothetical protein